MAILERSNGNGQSSSAKMGKHLYLMVVDREEMMLMLKHVLKTGREGHLTNDSSLEESGIAEETTRLLNMLPRREAGTNSVSPLSPRETEILTQVARGQSNKRIADSLCLSKHTVKNHIYSIRRKLDANDRAHAVVLAMLNGWLKIEDISEEPPPLDVAGEEGSEE